QINSFIFLTVYLKGSIPIFRASFSYFLSNPIEYLQRLFISNPANQSKDLGKKTENIKISGN
ncbi:hypothetical protein, partial [Anaerobutyricum hallii]|uniref:hypothetical protein n=1 Tax=Anaerobutyricum hallii TaxID=39488 RepID=UPI00399CF6D5